MEAKDYERGSTYMKRLIIICEGPSENEFCMEVLAPHFRNLDIYIEAPLIKRSNGGIVPWSAIKRQIEMHLHEGDVWVSMLIDYYGIRDNYKFPGWIESKDILSMKDRWQFLCSKMKADISGKLSSRFIPHIQIHEFESLLFSDIEIFKNFFDKSEMDFSILEAAIKEFRNPEDINSRPNLAPSKRLMSAIKSYDKILYGNFIASEIGLETLRTKCPIFNQWISNISRIVNRHK